MFHAALSDGDLSEFRERGIFVAFFEEIGKNGLVTVVFDASVTRPEA